MPGPLAAAGATQEPSEYAPLTMDRYITGLWTQRSPLRDADVPYLDAKFYSASRFDSLIDGLNREITAKLTLQRRCGTSVFNSNLFPAIQSFYSFRYVQNNIEQIRIIADSAANVWDATAGGKVNVWSKSAGAGKTRFLSVGPELFFGDGVETKKLMQSSKIWIANTAYNQGDFIIDPNGNLQSLQPITSSPTISNIQVVQAQAGGIGPFSNFLIVTFLTPAPAFQFNSPVSFSGLTNFTALNGASLNYQPISSAFGLALTANQIAFAYSAALYGPAADSGSATGTSNGNGTSGAVQPVWNTALGGTTADGSLQWQCFGTPVYDWQTAAPTTPPVVQPNHNTNFPNRYWQAFLDLGLHYSVLDTNGNVQTIVGNPGPGNITGASQPNWNISLGGFTLDGGYQWQNNGQVLSWQANTTFPFSQCILDSNGDLQFASVVVSPGQTGGSQPSWNPVLGGTTTDNNITWVNAGPGSQLRSGSILYAYSFHMLDGSLSTASPTFFIPNGVLGQANLYDEIIQGTNTIAKDCDQIWIWRTPAGQSTLVFLDSIPNPSIGSLANWSYRDILPDVSLTGGQQLNAQISAPIADSNDPPPKTATAPCYHMQRVWMIDGNNVVYSGGPDTLAGNGNTSFPPLNFFQYPEAITRLYPITVNNGGLVVCGTANIYIILGTGTATNPFYSTTYMPTVGFKNYDAIDIVGSTLYGFTSNRKVVSIDPSAGYQEVGFPIGDQFQKVTTGGITASIYDPLNTYVSWNERESGDSGIYVSDGAIGWFRYSPVTSPESGFLWSPRAAMAAGTSAVQSIETAPGEQTLLIGPNGSGPILMRDNTVFTDAGVSYNSYATIGNIRLCESGEIAEVAHVALISMRVGQQPQVGLLFGEIRFTPEAPFDLLDITSVDPPDLPESQTLFSDRYSTAQNGQAPKCMHCQLLINWPIQPEGDELLSHAIYGAKWAERKQH